MTPQEFINKIAKTQDDIRHCVQRVLPIQIGRLAKNHFQDNFIKGGFVNNGLQKWKPAKRIGKAKVAAGSYGTLLSERNHLYSSIDYIPGNGVVRIQNKLPYAAVHNEGGKSGRGKGFTMPKRQFIGESAELNDKIDKTIDKCITDELRKRGIL
ncbi:MAG: phage virion morphogenesis protein [Bacteroidales bacterium]